MAWSCSHRPPGPALGPCLLPSSRRQHQDGNIGLLAPGSAAELLAGEAREASGRAPLDRGRGPGRSPDPSVPLFGLQHHVTGGRQVVAERHPDRLLVLHQQDLPTRDAGGGLEASSSPALPARPVSRKTTSSAMLVTRSAIRSRLWAMSIRLVAGRPTRAAPAWSPPCRRRPGGRSGRSGRRGRRCPGRGGSRWW